MNIWRTVMTKEFEDRGTTYSIHENVNIGEVKVADEVVAIIAGLAATEVEGVDSLGGNITNEIVSKLGMKNLSKGVKVTVEESSGCYRTGGRASKAGISFSVWTDTGKNAV